MSHEERMNAAGIVLPEGYPPAGLYVSAVQSLGLLHVGGHGPVKNDGNRVTGKGGADLDLEAAQEAARLTGLQMLRSIRAELGSLDRVARVVKVFGMVNCAPGFNQTPAVINGCSQLFHDVFGDAGGHTRSAVGMAELPFDISVEIAGIVEPATNYRTRIDGSDRLNSGQPRPPLSRRARARDYHTDSATRRSPANEAEAGQANRGPL